MARGRLLLSNYLVAKEKTVFIATPTVAGINRNNKAPRTEVINLPTSMPKTAALKTSP